MKTDDEQTRRELFRHRKRDEWGMAIMVWERDGKRGYQFEDGRLRVFKRGYYQLLEEVEQPDSGEVLIAELDRMHGRRQAAQRKATPGRTPRLTFDQQLEVFRHEYPQGFDDPRWIDGMRGEGARRRLKRHRQPTIAAARDQLGAEQLAELIESERYDEVVRRALALLEGSSLATPKQLDPLRKLDATRHRDFAVALRDLLHEDEDTAAIRFDRLVHVLKQPSWQLATALPALLHPDQQVCVKPSSFRAQALWTSPDLPHTTGPNATTYLRYLSMAQAVRTKLIDAGLKPRDLLDVYDFIALTLRPSAAKLLARREEQSEEQGEGEGQAAA